MAKFNPMSFFEKNTTFFFDFKMLRTQWFAVEDRISSIKDMYEPVDWGEIRDSCNEARAPYGEVCERLQFTPTQITT